LWSPDGEIARYPFGSDSAGYYGVLEERLYCIWAELLGVSQVSVEDLFELGGLATCLKAYLVPAQR